jgi:hypothetical protein
MGAWGAGLFENDGALDWVGDLMDREHGWALVRTTLSGVGEQEEDESALDGESILAAAECVAVARGKPSAKPNPDIVTWCRNHPLKDAAPLAALAVKAVAWVRTSSELKDLWEEAGDPEWDRVVADLEKRLL